LILLDISLILCVSNILNSLVIKSSLADYLPASHKLHNHTV